MIKIDMTRKELELAMESVKINISLIPFSCTTDQIDTHNKLIKFYDKLNNIKEIEDNK